MGKEKHWGKNCFPGYIIILRDGDSWLKIGDDDFWDFKLHGFI
jgi:hypothetical protein